MAFRDSTLHNTAQERVFLGHPACESRISTPQPAFTTLPMSAPRGCEKDGFLCRRNPEVCQQLPPQLTTVPEQSMKSERTLTGTCCEQNCCQILACGRETILSCMTEGRLNRILDILRSQQTLSRMDYEIITTYPTLTGRARALLDTCLSLGERAAQTVVTVLSASKCSPMARGSQSPV
uniref:CARD domain-containing protein n=1 Tax=Sphenodon punctatus TaxID=8508 RepID=A0A8D0GGD3_SPHPU